ncbi:MAG: ATP-binding protein [Terriglobales bacterium]|jgi:two-component system sensor histidine kinase CpxA
MRSLFLRVFLSFWVAMVLVGLAMVVTFSMQRDVVVNRWRTGVGSAIGAYAQGAADEFEQHGPDSLVHFLQGLESIGGGSRAALLDAQGNPVITPLGSHSPRNLVDKALRSGQLEFRDNSDSSPEPYAAQRVTSRSGHTYVLILHRVPGFYSYHLSASMEVLRWTMAIVISGLICLLLTRHLTMPILRLGMAARQLAAGDLGARAPVPGNRSDEIGVMVQDFNRMAERIEGLVNSQRQLISDISHELRSPLARLSVALGLARQRAGTGAAAPLDRIEREADQLNELIGKLLTLARLETAALPPEQSSVDLQELLMQIVDDAAFEAQERGCDVRLQPLVSGTRSFPVLGSADLLRSALENVIRNAVRYTAPGTAVAITLACDGRSVVVHVRDHGPGVPEVELANLFRPFYRLADARDRQTGGTGLGLTIAERAVRLHGGSIRASTLKGNKGLDVEIILPAASEQDANRQGAEVSGLESEVRN